MSRKPRKDQEIVDFADKIRKDLGDTRPRSFGLYMRIIKEFGKDRVREAFWQAVRRPAKDKVRYFLGIISHMRDRKETLKAYHKLRAPLLAKMTPMRYDADRTVKRGRRIRNRRASRQVWPGK